MKPTAPLLLALLAACGAGGADLKLPRLGAVGMDPARLDPPPLVVSLYPEGRVTVAGRDVGPGDLEPLFFAHAETVRDMESPNQESLAWLVLRCDRRVPWRNVQWVMQAAADPSVRIWRIVFAVRPEEGEGEASFAVFLQRDRRHGSRMIPDRGPNVIDLQTGEGAPARPRNLAATHALLTEEHRAMPMEVNAWPEVPAGRVLRMLDVLARVGHSWVLVWGTPAAPTGWRATDPSAHPPLSGFLNRRPFVAGGAPVPPARHRDGLGGFAESPPPEAWGELGLPGAQNTAGSQIWTDRPPLAPPPPTGAVPWLAGQWREDGGFGDTATSSLVLLAILSTGNTHKHGPFKKVVREGLRALKQGQDPAGRFSEDPLAHALASAAMAEGYGLTASPLFKASAQSALAAPFPEGAPREAAEWFEEAKRIGKSAGLDVSPSAEPPADPLLRLRFLARSDDPAFKAEYLAARAAVLAREKPDGSFGDLAETARAVLILRAQDLRPAWR
ncbi:MAG: hypothetical protein MUE73_05885 [Planctomycetes bacterium]|jgi:hypothetical protein|nr:hypothetical protein [Planctomycetota bacterium]